MLNGYAIETSWREMTAPKQGSDDMGGQSRGKDIFIVDDDPAVRDLLTEVFHQAGYPVTSFVDGASFAIAAKARIPACVILDIYLPGRSGLEILKDIDAPNYPAPIFIASGRG